jgi:hypothetical protein
LRKLSVSTEERTNALTARMTPEASRNIHRRANDLSKPAERYARDAILRVSAVGTAYLSA